MAFLNTESGARGDLAHGIRERIAGFFAGLKAGFEAYVELQARSEEIQRLHALTDDELARLGLERDRIVQHVFRDKFGL